MILNNTKVALLLGSAWWQLQLAPLENIMPHNETYFETPRLLRASGSVEVPQILDLGC